MPRRVPLVAGNWKMNLDLEACRSLARRCAQEADRRPGVEVLVAPPFPYLLPVKEALGEGRVLLAAQNMHWEQQGAYTGEVSGPMVRDVGCTHVILGHSERRGLFGETSEMVDRKVEAALECGLRPIVCVGETLEEREAGKTFAVVEAQLQGSLRRRMEARDVPPALTVAYEPVWAIGTGRTASPEQAQEVHAFIRRWWEAGFGPGAASELRILYGGSVHPGNVEDLTRQKDIDGVLVGGASLRGDSFAALIHGTQC